MVDNENIYKQKGYRSRKHYLEEMADEYCLPEKAVEMMADLLGPDEDFDGLLNILEDAMNSGEFDY